MKPSLPSIHVGASPRRAAQKGVGTVFVAMVLVLAASLIVLYTHRAAIMEQRLSGNEIRQKQAFAAATAGIDHALAEMRKAGGIPLAGSPAVPKALQSDAGTLRYEARYCKPDAIPACPAAKGALACTAPDSATSVAAVSCGWSDDNASVQRIVQLMGNTPSLAGTISTPLISKGTTNLVKGGASIYNYFDDLTVWSGGDLVTANATGKTFIREKVAHPVALLSDPYRATVPNCDTHEYYLCTTSKDSIGHDIVQNDTNLSSLSADGFFRYFFGLSPTSYLNEKVTYVVDINKTLLHLNLEYPASTGPNYTQSIGDLDDLKGKSIWVDGNADLNGGTIGTENEPVVLIVNGDFVLRGNVVINGLVYVSGSFDAKGNGTIYGGLVVGGTSAAGGGNFEVIYDPKTLGGSDHLGKAAKLPGGWRDW